MKILLTGFDRFRDLPSNPSQVIVQSILERWRTESSAEVLGEVLPTEYSGAGDRIRELVRAIRPDAVVCLGVASGSSRIGLERVALNVDDADLPDNSGAIAGGRFIADEGPVGYWSTLPLASILKTLHDRDIPACISNHAGTYVCNHVFYVARHQIEQLACNTRCGLIHVPLMSEGIDVSVESPPSMPLGMMIEAIECSLEVILREIRKSH